jgi:hypothetical protein
MDVELQGGEGGTAHWLLHLKTLLEMPSSIFRGSLTRLCAMIMKEGQKEMNTTISIYKTHPRALIIRNIFFKRERGHTRGVGRETMISTRQLRYGWKITLCQQGGGGRVQYRR